MVTAIVPAFGRLELTLGAVERLRRQSRPPAEILVVDDGSRQSYPDIPGVRLLRHGQNLGFAAAVNTGVAAAGTPLVAVLNNDVTLAPDWLERLEMVITSRAAAFACGKLYRPDGLIDGTYDLISRGGLAWRVGAGRPDGPLWSQAGPVAMTSFTAVLLRREVFLDLGGMDASYHSYYEDAAWSLLAAIHNKTGYFDPETTGIHEGSATAGPRSAYSARQLLANHRRLAHQFLLPAYRRQYLVARALFRAQWLRHGYWPRNSAKTVEKRPENGTFDAFLSGQEAELRRLQTESGQDHLWKWYFRLAS